MILEGIDDELNSKQRSVSDVSPYLQTTVPGADPGYNLNWVATLNHFLEFDQLTMEDQLKFKIAASFLIQLQNREAKTLLDIMERRNELDLWPKINMYNLPRVSNECYISAVVNSQNEDSYFPDELIKSMSFSMVIQMI